MRRRTEHLVEKRDGRREFLRATKLARSIHLALNDIGVNEDWRAMELATVLLEGLRCRQQDRPQSPGGGATATVLRTSDISDAVQQLLVVTGLPAAAARYGELQAERSRRRRSIAQLPLQDRGVAQTAEQATATEQAAATEQATATEPGSVADRLAGRWPGEG